MSNGVQTLLIVLALAGTAVVFFGTPAGGAICDGWRVAAMIGKAIIYVPWGLFLLALATWITMVSEGNPIILLIAGWVGWHGGNHVFGSLAGFTRGLQGERPGAAALASRSELRRRGLLGRR